MLTNGVQDGSRSARRQKVFREVGRLELWSDCLGDLVERSGYSLYRKITLTNMQCRNHTTVNPTHKSGLKSKGANGSQDPQVALSMCTLS